MSIRPFILYITKDSFQLPICETESLIRPLEMMAL